ncbi:MAG: hypothetical protein JM58_01330 [Peptococcaceae bacterium BICA1-8]|nr:MAG: hypothetical protein JM58_01330 [Peptococcaceae bacterium BICA1-8]
MENEKGMTLVEVIVAMVIISLALITMISLFDVGLNTTSKAEKETKAVSLAQVKLEEAKDKLNRGQPAGIVRTAFSETENQGYEYEVQVSGGSLKMIKVVVYYGRKTVELVTKLGERNG